MMNTTTSAAQGCGPRKMTMDLVCGSIGVQANQREAIGLAQRHGFESVGPDADYLGRLADDQLQELLADLKGKGLKWGAAGLPVEFRKDHATFRASMRGLPGFAQALRRAGVTRVGTWLTWGDNGLTYLQQIKQYAIRLRETAKRLREHGLRFGLEYVAPKTFWSNTRFPWVHTMAECRELIDVIQVDNIGLVLDSWHWYHARETADDILMLRNEDVVAVDLNDAPKDVPRDQMPDSPRRLPASTGVIDVGAFLSALNKIGYDGPVRAEPFDESLKTMSPDQAVAATAEAMKKAFALIQVSATASG